MYEGIRNLTRSEVITSKSPAVYRSESVMIGVDGASADVSVARVLSFVICAAISTWSDVASSSGYSQAVIDIAGESCWAYLAPTFR